MRNRQILVVLFSLFCMDWYLVIIDSSLEIPKLHKNTVLVTSSNKEIRKAYTLSYADSYAILSTKKYILLAFPRYNILRSQFLDIQI